MRDVPHAAAADPQLRGGGVPVGARSRGRGGCRPCDCRRAYCRRGRLGATEPRLGAVQAGCCAGSRCLEGSCGVASRRVHADRLLKRAGLSVRRFDPRLRPGTHLGWLLQEYGVAHVIDVGANVGQFAQLIRDEAGFKGRVDSFEPVRGAFAELASTMRSDPNWHGHRVAVSSIAGTATMHVYSSSVLNSLSTTTSEGNAVFGKGGEFSPAGTEEVATTTLDGAGLPDLGPVMLKVDTQGFDWEVLAGANVTLARTVVLTMELSFVPLYEAAVPAWESLQRLDDLGFGLASLDTVGPAPDRIRIGEADGTFVRKVR